jgi:hypothetical protein
MRNKVRSILTAVFRYIFWIVVHTGHPKRPAPLTSLYKDLYSYLSGRMSASHYFGCIVPSPFFPPPR